MLQSTSKGMKLGEYNQGNMYQTESEYNLQRMIKKKGGEMMLETQTIHSARDPPKLTSIFNASRFSTQMARRTTEKKTRMPHI